MRHDPVRPILSTYQTNYHRRMDDLQGAQDDGVTLGFFYGLAAATIAWLVLSGALVRILATIVRVLLVVTNGGQS